MFGKKFTLFKLFGFTVGIDLSWFFILVLVSWSLATGLLPRVQPGLQSGAYWLMGIAGALGLFISIVIHELAHSLVARNFGLPMTGITLFIFGGVAEMADEPPSPRAEFSMAVAGPITSIVIGGIFYAASLLLKGHPSARPFYGVVRYLGIINGGLAAFNLIPAFPLDGGRVLRSALWKARNNIRWATRLSSRIGSAFAFLLIAFGVFSLIRGNFVGGMWWFVIGLFLNNAARSAYQQLITKRILEGEKVRRFMQENPVTVPGGLTIKQLVEEYVYKYHFKMFPVVDDGKLVGCVTTRQLHSVPRSAWSRRRVEALAASCSPDNTVSPDADAIKALGRMKRTENSRLMVVEHGKLVGVISLKDMLKFISLKVELEEESI